MPGCVIEQAVNDKLKSVFNEAEQLLMTRLQGVTLADIAQNFSASMAKNGHSGKAKQTSA
jgi:hypothetical protein